MGQDVAAWLGGVGGWASVAIVRATDTQWPPTHNGLTMASVAIVRATDTETIVRATQGTPARGPISKFPWIERAGLWGGRVGAVVGVVCGRCGRSRLGGAPGCEKALWPASSPESEAP